MKKTIPISIAHTLFYIEEDTYQKLDNYLSEIRKYFGSYEDQKEIIDDIEDRIREQLLQFSEEDKTERIITEKHIECLIKTMGWPKEFGSFDASEHTETKTHAKTRKRLYRDKENAVIGGVASGIAAYFNIDPVIVRIIFVLIALSGGIGIPLYIVMWFAVPAAQTATEKLEMQGEPVNLGEVKKMVEEKISEVGRKENLKKGVKNFFEELHQLIIKIWKAFWKITSVIVGTIFKIVSVIGATAMLVFLALGIMSMYAQNIFSELSSLPYFFSFIVLLFIVGFIPFILLNKLGNFCLGYKDVRTRKNLGFVFAVWIAAVILTPILFIPVGEEYLQKLHVDRPRIIIDHGEIYRLP